MAIRTYKVTLDSKNTIAPEPVYLRQGDKTGAVVIDATLMDNGAPVSIDGLTPMFKANTADGQAVIADSTGFNIVNASGGEFTYQVPNALSAVPGKIMNAYFSFSDTSGSESTFDVAFIIKKTVDITKPQADDYITIIDGTLQPLQHDVQTILDAFNQGNFYNKSETDNKDAVTLTSAKSYADFADSTTLQNAKLYTNSQISTVPPIMLKDDAGTNYNQLHIKTGINMFNPLRVTANSYIDAPGNLATSTGWYASDFIKINPSASYYKNNNSPIAYYDNNKAYISRDSVSGKLFNTPANVSYIRINLNPEDGLTPYQIMLTQSNKPVPWEHYHVMADSDLIESGSVDADKLDFVPAEMHNSDNLFNFRTAIAGYYAQYNTGKLDIATNFYASDFIKISGNANYIKTNNQQIAFYDSEKNYLSGLASATSFTAPEFARYAKITVEKEFLMNLQLKKDVKISGYIRYGAEPTSDNYMLSTQVITVGAHGCNYTKISDALSSIPLDNKEVPIILVMPGVYEESIRAYGRRFVLRGTSRTDCTIINYLNDYYNPPIDAAPGNTFENLTVIAGENATTPKEGVNGLPAYATHVDISGRGLDFTNTAYQGKTVFRNCDLISYNQHAAGVGLVPNQSVIFDRCNFESHNNKPAFRAHNYYPKGGAGAQRLQVIDCQMHTIGSGPVIVLQDPSHSSNGGQDSNDVEFTFMRSIIFNDANNNLLIIDVSNDIGKLAGYIGLGRGSFGNNVAKLNQIFA